MRVHEAEWEAHGDGQQPHEHNLEGDSTPRLVAAEAHRIAEAEVAVHGYGAQVHDGSRAEQYVQAHPNQAVHRRQREEPCRQKHNRVSAPSLLKELSSKP